LKTADAHGNPVNRALLSKRNAFRFINASALGAYLFDLKAAKVYGMGTYIVTIYGDAFPAYQGQFRIVK
jgi:hypothetical protein